MDLKPRQRWIAIAGVTVLSAIAVAGFAIAIYAAWLFHDMGASLAQRVGATRDAQA